jgi:hypothetical protein
MSAFVGYDGVYKHQDETFIWRCYATARVYDMRCGDHAPLPPAPVRKRWASARHRRFEKPVAFLVDEGVTEFSQMLVQVLGEAKVSRRRRHGIDDERLGAA